MPLYILDTVRTVHIFETHLFCRALQMITTQKQLIENADAVQEKIAQVQREGAISVCLTCTRCNQGLCPTLMSICVGLILQLEQFRSLLSFQCESDTKRVLWEISNSLNPFTSRDSSVRGGCEFLRPASLFGPMLNCCVCFAPSGMDFHEDLSRLGDKEGLKGRKLSKAVESFTWNITVLKVSCWQPAAVLGSV